LVKLHKKYDMAGMDKRVQEGFKHLCKHLTKIGLQGFLHTATDVLYYFNGTFTLGWKVSPTSYFILSVGGENTGWQPVSEDSYKTMNKHPLTVKKPEEVTDNRLKLHKKYRLSGMGKDAKKGFKQLCKQLVDSACEHLLDEADNIVRFGESINTLGLYLYTLDRQVLCKNEGLLLLKNGDSYSWVSVPRSIYDRVDKYPMPPKKRKALIDDTGHEIAEVIFETFDGLIKKYEERTGLSIGAKQKLKLDIS